MIRILLGLIRTKSTQLQYGSMGLTRAKSHWTGLRAVSQWIRCVCDGYCKAKIYQDHFAVVPRQERLKGLLEELKGR